MQALGPLVFGVGVAQLVSWGTLYYAIGVLGPAMARDVGVSEAFLFGAFTAGLLVSGAASPFVGRLIDRRGGRFVLAGGSALAAVAMAVLALAGNPVMLVLGWLLAGAAVAACLYDPAFATLSQHVGAGYRRAVTVVTIFGGFASTVFWPLSHILMGAWGWRATFAIYAGLHVFVCLSIHLFLVPRRLRLPHDDSAQPTRVSVPGLGYLSLAFAAAAFASAVVAVHFVSLVTAKGLTPAQAISLGMLIGPAQVAGRIAEFGFASRWSVVQLGYAAFGLVLAALLALLAAGGIGVAIFVFVIAYGLGNGLYTIVRGTVPAALYGREQIGAILGLLARVALYSRALAPAAFSGLLALGVTQDLAQAILATLVAAALGSFGLGVREARRTRARDAS